MLTATKPLLSLTAADLMTGVVMTIPLDMSLQGAARLFTQAHVSGAPVVDSTGRCVGVLSATDFLALAEKSAQAVKQTCAAHLCINSAWQIVDPQDLPADVVRHYMTADPVTTTSETPIGDLAQMMLDAHIHRIIVVDPEGRPTGIVSTTDVLAALAHAWHVESISTPVPRAGYRTPISRKG
jgi:CBS-domain-containing membrane protein